ncbi:MAG: hypothetical protein AAF532_06195 [Planctomycetota bacterium]
MLRYCVLSAALFAFAGTASTAEAGLFDLFSKDSCCTPCEPVCDPCAAPEPVCEPCAAPAPVCDPCAPACETKKFSLPSFSMPSFDFPSFKKGCGC